jgi:DNA polymerase/3'-5' exonuclease PolX
VFLFRQKIMSKVEMELATARVIAKQKFKLLRPYCDQIDVAGSVRRNKPTVGDIEIVCVPKFNPVRHDLFGAELPGQRDSSFITAVKQIGDLIKGDPATGRYLQSALPEGIYLDLFMTTRADYFRQLAIRTGPSDYSRECIAGQWRKIGWCGTEQGLRKVDECEKIDDKKWKCVHPKPTLPPIWKSEKEFFDWLGLAFLEPSSRK